MFHRKSLMRREWQNKIQKSRTGINIVRVEIKAVFFLSMQCLSEMVRQTKIAFRLQIPEGWFQRLSAWPAMWFPMSAQPSGIIRKSSLCA